MKISYLIQLLYKVAFYIILNSKKKFISREQNDDSNFFSFIFYNQSKQKNYRLFSNFSFPWIFLFFWIEWFSEFCSIYFHAENIDLFEKMSWMQINWKKNENKRNYSLLLFRIIYIKKLYLGTKKNIFSHSILILY